MESNSTFDGGLNKDVSELLKKQNTYVDALNVDLILDEINGSFVLSNSKGNKYQNTIPTSYKIHSWSSVTTSSFDNFIFIGSNSGKKYINSPDKTNYDLYVFITTNFSAFINNGNISVYYNDTNVTIVEHVNMNFLFFNGLGITVNSSKEVPQVDTHYPIGYTTINNDLYIISTNRNENPDTSTTVGYGFIWKFEYDKESFDPTKSVFTLIYAADLNLSTYYHIPKTGIVGRYETENIQKIWWTDNFNPIKKINVKDPNAFAEDPTTLSFNVNFDYYKPILTGIKDSGSGTLTGGTYSACYRLRKTGSSNTVVSEISNPVHIPESTISASYIAYYGGTGGTSKTITWNVSNIDTDFDFIDFIVLVQNSGTYGDWSTKDDYEIYKVHEEDINNRESIDFSVDKAQIDAGIAFTLAEINAYTDSSWFTHAKTIAEKDQYLIAANLRNENSNSYLGFDARAFRSKTPNTVNIVVKNNDTLKTYTSLSDAYNSLDTDDNINDYDTSDECLYKPGTSILGGEGKNVSYEFYTISTVADSNSLPIVSGYAPYFSTNKTTDNVSLDVPFLTSTQQYNLLNLYTDNKNPQLSGLIRGYTRGEIYRFGIEFFSKDKKPLFTEWIGDIKFPDHFDSNTNAYYSNGTKNTSLNNFNISHMEGNILYTNSLGIKFTVNNVDSISNKIGGYSIVRVERKSADKRIITQGFVNGPSSATGSIYAYSGLIPGQGRSGFFHSPELFNSDKVLTSGNKIRYIYTALGSSGTSSSTDTLAGKTFYNESHGVKYYVFNAFPKTDEYSITSVNTMSGEEVDPAPIINRSQRVKASILGSALRYVDYGLPCYYYELDLSFGLNTYPTSDDTPLADYDLYQSLGIANYIQELSNQYDGNTYNARSGNVYISTGHFRPINDSNNASSSETFEVFGGDTYVSIYDTFLFRKDWADDTSTKRSRHSHIVMIPLESDVNTTMRADFTPNRNFTSSFDLTHDNVASHYYDKYFPVYSSENNIKSYFPKPNPFNEVNRWVNRFAASEKKINGENEESWSTFQLSSVWDVEGGNGEINAIVAHSNRMYFWQDKAFGIMHIKPNIAFTDTTNPSIDSQVQLGFGSILQRHDYISNIVGTKHSNSIVVSSMGLYWVSTNNKKIYGMLPNSQGSLSLTPLSDSKGLYADLNKNFNSTLEDKPCFINTNGDISGIVGINDIRTNKIYFTFHNNSISFTIGYNEITNTFISYYSFKPSIFINDNTNLLSFDLNDLYIHEKGDYGNYYNILNDSSLSFIVNIDPISTKVFDNLVINSKSVDSQTDIDQNQDTWKKIRVTNDYQNSDFIDLVYNNNIKRLERSWNLAIPRNRVLYTSSDSPDIYTDISSTDKPFGERIRDKYIKVDLEYDNANNNHLKTTNIKTIYRKSSR